MTAKSKDKSSDAKSGAKLPVSGGQGSGVTAARKKQRVAEKPTEQRPAPADGAKASGKKVKTVEGSEIDNLFGQLKGKPKAGKVSGTADGCEGHSLLADHSW